MSLDSFFDGPSDDFDASASNNPKPHEGLQICILKSYGPKKTTKKGVILCADLIVVQPAPGSTYAPGALIKLAWFLSETDETKLRYEVARARDFVLELLGLPKGTAYGPHSKQLSGEKQPGTGIALKIYGEKNGEYLNYRYEHLAGQTGESITQNRAAIGQLAAQQNPQGLPAVPPHVAAQVPLAAPPPQYAAPTAPLLPQPIIPVAPAPVIGIPGFKF